MQRVTGIGGVLFRAKANLICNCLTKKAELIHANVMTKTYRLLACTLSTLVLLPALNTFAQEASPTIQLRDIFDLRGQTDGPSAEGVSRGGEVVGFYQDIADNYTIKGFARSKRGRLVEGLVFPGEGTMTYAQDINASGTICGFYNDSAGATHGWFLVDGTYSSFDVPGALLTEILGINDGGDFVGIYTPSGTTFVPFIDIGGTITTIDFGFPTTNAFATAISSNGTVTGTYRILGDPLTYGFILAADGTLTTGIEEPLAESAGTFCSGINSHGWVVGNYWTEFNGYAFLFKPPHHFITYSIQNADSTYFTGINDDGLITGYYVDDSGQAHGLVLQVVQ